MSNAHFKQKSLVLAKQIYPELEGEALISEAERIFVYLSSNAYQNFVGYSMVSDDIVSFASMLFLQDNSAGKSVPLILRDYQIDALEKITDGHDHILLHGRNMGVSLMLRIYALWTACFRNSVNMGYVVIHKEKARQTIREIIALHASCAFCGVRISNYTSSSITFDNGNKIHFIGPSTYVVGHSLTHVVADDAANISYSDDDNFYSTILFANTGPMIAASVPANNMGIFHELTLSSILSTTTHKLPYSLHPDYSEGWEKHVRLELGDETYENQYNCKFRDVRN